MLASRFGAKSGLSYLELNSLEGKFVFLPREVKDRDGAETGWRSG